MGEERLAELGKILAEKITPKMVPNRTEIMLLFCRALLWDTGL